jgi:hypothetical protein
MRNLVIIGLLATVSLVGGGCQTPAYSPAERASQIGRTWKVDSRQVIDDFDSALLLRPPSRMTIWHIR